MEREDDPIIRAMGVDVSCVHLYIGEAKIASVRYRVYACIYIYMQHTHTMRVNWVCALWRVLEECRVFLQRRVIVDFFVCFCAGMKLYFASLYI